MRRKLIKKSTVRRVLFVFFVVNCVLNLIIIIIIIIA